ncbi:hypothetical protein GUJ93_ZPchr0012g20351 [Zizania palustris]|uniref:Uncharacterized protein n=1 Tax=Zizania palustris TaxID=103762 RepID=A0A8J5WXB6_ZIZPA|nr:hypothetical protein GUJ93_ZPchr0012g20351 [Zizania palustris]
MFILGELTSMMEYVEEAVNCKQGPGMRTRIPREEVIPAPRSREVVVFETFFEAGLGLPSIDFLAEVMEIFHVTLP